MKPLFKRLRSGRQKPWLLLAWDITGLKAAVFAEEGGQGRIVATTESPQARFTEALDEILLALGRQSEIRPQRVALAARSLLPGVVNLPVPPDRPRPTVQMRELVQSEIEPVLAEFGSLWSMGALLEARRHLSAMDREKVTLEEAMRREGRRTPLRYGETALEMELIHRAALDECLDLQEHLQNLDASTMAGWRGRIQDKHPLWLACGVGAANYQEWQDAITRRHLRLEACLPLVWLASESTAEAAPEKRRDGPVATVSLELHQEEVVAVHRQNGLVLAARSEGRMERRLHADWLARLLADWSGEARLSVELVCLHTGDEALANSLCDDLGLCTGHPVQLRPVGESWERFWLHLAREASGDSSRLPRIVERELRGSLWNDHDIRRLAAIGVVIAGLGVVEGLQRYKLYRLNTTVAEKSQVEKTKAHRPTKAKPGSTPNSTNWQRTSTPPGKNSNRCSTTTGASAASAPCARTCPICCRCWPRPSATMRCSTAYATAR